LDKLQQVDAVLRVSMDDLLTSDVREVIFQNLLTKQVDKRLNILCHLGHILASCQLTKVDLRECGLEELNVKLVTIRYIILKINPLT